jgi:DNA modification methylase
MTTQLIHGDCLEKMQDIESGSVDLILTDPPYGTTACKWDSVIPFEPMWKQYKRVLRPNGFMVLTASQPFTTKLINSNIDQFSHQWIWQKEQGSNPLLANVMPMKNFEDVIVFYNEHKSDVYLEHPLREYSKKMLFAIGKNIKQINLDLGHRRAEHFFYIKSTQYELCTEVVYNQLLDFYNLSCLEFVVPYYDLKKVDDAFGAQYPRTYNPQKTSGLKYKSGGGYIKTLDSYVDGGNISSERFPTSIIKFNTDKSKSKHPTQKPVALMEYMIKTYTNIGDIVLDNCMGSGTTGEACDNLNRNFIGIELDADYFKIASDRIAKPVEIPLF